MNKLFFLLVCCIPALLCAQPPGFTGPHTLWHENFFRYDYLMDTATLAITPYTAPPGESLGIKAPPKGEGPGMKKPMGEGFGVQDPPPGFRRCIVVVPNHPAPGNPWSWRGCYWDHQPQTEIELLKRGFFVCYISANATLVPGREWDAFYNWLTREKGLSSKPAFIGMSRGGEYEYRWATTHPGEVSCIYADNPAIDRESLTLLGGLAANDVPLLHVCGSIDPLYWGSTLAVEGIYRAFGGRISVIVKEGFGHHPHSLHDATPIADFIGQSFREQRTPAPDFVKAVYTGPGAAGATPGASGATPGASSATPGASSATPGAAGAAPEPEPPALPKTWYYSSLATNPKVPAEKPLLSERGPYFSGAYARYQLLIPGVDAFTTVIVPAKPAPGRPWVLRADYVLADDRITQGLLAKGWTIVTGAVPYNYDGPVPAQWNAIYTYLTGYGFAAKPVLMGRGGAVGEVTGWAIANPTKVACIYGEDPILESRLMLGGQSPLDTLAPLAKAGVPVLFVCGEESPVASRQSAADQSPARQAQLAATRYRQAGGNAAVRLVKGQGHFLPPEDTTDVLEFIRQSTGSR
jgi:pimeloyl-ACP methyl ester carboxylesterase